MTVTAPEPTFLPHDPTPAEAGRARDLTSALVEVQAHGGGLLTPNEHSLIEALRLRVRARVRQSGFDDEPAYKEATQRLLAAAKAIGEEPLS